MNLRTGVGCNALDSWNERDTASDEPAEMKFAPSTLTLTLSPLGDGTDP